MTKRTFLTVVIVSVCVLAAIFVSVSLNQERPFKGLQEVEISASIHASEILNVVHTIPDTKELTKALRLVILYEADNSYTASEDYTPHFHLLLSDGTRITADADTPFIVINGVTYRCNDVMNQYYNRNFDR